MQIAAAIVEPLDDDRNDRRNALSTMTLLDGYGAKYDRREMYRVLTDYLESKEASLSPAQVKAMSGG